MNILQQFLSLFRSGPDPEFIAGQLRKPSGNFAEKIGPKMNEVNEPLFNLTLDTMDPLAGEKILEIGFGTGKFFHKLLSISDQLQVFGIDYSPEMTNISRENNQRAIDNGKLHLECGPSDDLPYPDDFFDKIFCNMVIYFWDDPAPHLQEVNRVLKDGGTFYSGIRTRDSMLVFPFVEYGFTLYSVDEWVKILAEHDLIHIDTRSALDPAIEVNNNKVQLESCCISAVKASTSN